MRIAVTYENGEIFQHFGHTERFKVYDVEGGRVSVTAVVNTNGSGHGAPRPLFSCGYLPESCPPQAWLPQACASSCSLQPCSPHS